MRRLIIRILVIVSASAVLLTAALAAFVRFYFPPEKITPLVLSFLIKQSGRQIRFARAEMGLRGISVERLEVSHVPDFSKGVFLRADSMILKVEPLKLLRGEVSIESLSADSPDINYTRRRPAPAKRRFGSFASKPPQREAQKIPVLLKAMHLRNASLHIYDETTGAVLDVSRLRLDADELRPDGLNEFSAAFTARLRRSGTEVTMPVKTLFSMDISRPMQTVRFLSLETNNASAQFSGGGRSVRIDSFSARAAGTLTGHVAGRAIVRARLGNNSVPAYMNGDFSLLNFASAPILHVGRADFTLGSLAGNAGGNVVFSSQTVADVKLRVNPFSSNLARRYFARMPANLTLPMSELYAGVVFSSGTVTVRDLRFTAGPLHLTGGGVFKNALSYRFTASADMKLPELNTSGIRPLKRILKTNYRIPESDLGAFVVFTPSAVHLASSAFTSEGMSVRASALLTKTPQGWEKTFFRITHAAGRLEDLSTIIPSLRQYNMTGDFSGALSLWPSVMGSFSVSNLAAEAFENEISSGSVSFLVSGNTLTTTSFAGMLNDSPFTADLKVTRARKTSVDVAMRVKKLQLARLNALMDFLLAPSDGPVKPFDLDMDAAADTLEHARVVAKNAVISCDLKNITDHAQTISGTLQIQAAEAFPVKAAAAGKRENSTVARVLLLPVSVVSQTTKTLGKILLPAKVEKFTDIFGEYAFDNGILRIRSTRILSNVSDMSMSGYYDIVNDRLDVKLSTRLRGIVGAVSSSIIANISGSFSSPDVQVSKISMLNPIDNNTLYRGMESINGIFKKGDK